MGNIIEDGGGDGYKANVSSDHRLLTRAVTETEEIDANERGDAYNVNTGTVTLTDDVDTPVFYIKNNEEKELVIVTLIFGFGSSTGGTTTEMIEITIIRNPTGGTIVSGATNVDISSNRNYGSSNTMDALAYKGATGLTLTGGEDHIFAYASPKGRTVLAINENIPKGSSMGIKIKPQSSNTSMPIYVAAVSYLHEDE